MNWLNPDEVRAWLADHPLPASMVPYGVIRPDVDEAMEQFVRAMAQERLYDIDCDCERCQRISVARAIVEAMGEK